MPIKTGRYYIINVQTKNQAYLPNPNSAEPIQSWYKQDNVGEQWNIIDRKNGHHTIKNIGHKQFAASGSRAKAGEQVVGWERDQTWLIQKTRIEGQYTISTTDSRRFWGLADIQEGTPIALAEIYTDPRNWWMFKDIETGKDAEVDPDLDNGRTAYDTAAGDMIIQAVMFELALPPVAPPKPFELDLLIIQEMPNEFISNATETVNKICRPLIKSRQLAPSDLFIRVYEFEHFQKVNRYRPFSGSFDAFRDYRGVDFPWMGCPRGAIPYLLNKGMQDFRPSSTKVVVLNLRFIPIRNGGKSLWTLISQMAEQGIILILTLSEPHLPDTLFDTDLFREWARMSSGIILNLPADGFYPCIVDYLQEFDADSIKEKFPTVAVIKPELPLRQRKHLTLDAFLEKGYGDDPDLAAVPDDYYDRFDSDDDTPDEGDEQEDENEEEEEENEEGGNEDNEEDDDVQSPGTFNPAGGDDFGPSVPIPTWNRRR